MRSSHVTPHQVFKFFSNVVMPLLTKILVAARNDAGIIISAVNTVQSYEQ